MFAFSSSSVRLPDESRFDVAPQVVRALIGIAMAACVASIATVLIVTRVQQPQAFTGGLVSSLSFAVLLVVAAAVATRGRLKLAVTVALAAMPLGITLYAVTSKLGIHTLLLGGFGITVLVAGVVSGMRIAALFAGACAAAVVGMYCAEQAGWLPGPEHAAIVPGSARLIAHFLLLSTSLLFAWMLARIVRGSLEASRHQEERFRWLFVHSPLACVIHRAGRIELANAAAAHLFGYASAEAMTGLALALLDYPGQQAPPSVLLSASEGVPVGATAPSSEMRLRRRDGRELLVDAHVMRIAQPYGSASLSVFVDLTERKRAEAQLARSEALLSRLFKASVDSIIVASVPNGRIELVNQGFSDLVGIPINEAHDRTTLELGLWNDRTERERFMTRLQQEGVLRNYPARIRRADGTPRSVLLSSSVFDLDDSAFSVTIMRDVTQEQRERLEYAAILDSALVGIVFLRNRRFELVNARFEEMFGWSRGAIRGQSGEVVWPSFEDYLAVGRRTTPMLKRGEAVDFEHQVRRRDGSLFWCHVRGRAVDGSNLAGGTIWIAEDITRRRAADAALAAAKEAAEAASRAKSMFLANTSHEIRTPLNGVLGLARLALQPDVDAGSTREYLQRIHDSAEALSDIINDILDLSKIEAGKLAIEHTAFDLRALLDSVFNAYRELARTKGLGFEMTVVGEATRYVAGDPTRTRQILANFVSNAIKFTERGRVAIEVRQRGGGIVRFAVADSGIGIDAATKARLFTPFTQADASTTRRYGGTGLGLSICRELAHLMGGQVDMQSEPGAGSTFWADLPLPAAAAPATLEPVASCEEDLSGLRVLLVEDNPVNLLIADTLLRTWGVTVEQANDGRQAIAAVERCDRFDAVLMDVHMPVMSGHEATIELRKRHAKEDLPIVALTAAALASEQEQSLAIGMNDFISKPFDSARLRSVLLQVTAHRRRPAEPA
ncbi:MAG TPA: PAS domain S-box protein [Burkholderiaceae bacterium]|nr:PAS domain S-box protein [Burkholderiaceae bacterium]